MSKTIVIFILSIFIAYSCKKDNAIVESATPQEVDTPVTIDIVILPAMNQKFVGNYVGKMAYRSFYSFTYDPWILRDTVIVIGTHPTYPDYNTTSLQHIPSIHFLDSSGYPGAPSGSLTIFKFEGDSLYYHGKTASGAGLEIEFHGIKTP